jgi:hypothetical protein
MDQARLRELGYPYARQLANGEWLALQPQIFTTALCLGIATKIYEVEVHNRTHILWERDPVDHFETLLHGSTSGRSDPMPSWSHAMRT